MPTAQTIDEETGFAVEEAASSVDDDDGGSDDEDAAYASNGSPVHSDAQWEVWGQVASEFHEAARDREDVGE